jgi:copper chaperone CopZ
MIHQSFQLAAALDAAGAAKVTQALRAIAGVADTVASDGASRVGVMYDGESTSSDEIATVLARAGYPLRDTRKDSVCCGGCGGGGH